MICDRCAVPVEYNYYVNDEHWLRANGGEKEGHLCAHCLLTRLGGVAWQIIWSEPMEKSAETGE